MAPALIGGQALAGAGEVDWPEKIAQAVRQACVDGVIGVTSFVQVKAR